MNYDHQSLWVIGKFFHINILLPRRSLQSNWWQPCAFFVRHMLFDKHSSKISQNQSRLGAFKISIENSFWHFFSGMVVIILSSLQVYVSTVFSLHNYQPSFIMMPMTHASLNKCFHFYLLIHLHVVQHRQWAWQGARCCARYWRFKDEILMLLGRRHWNSLYITLYLFTSSLGS